MRLWPTNPDKQSFGGKAWGLLCIRYGRHPQKHTLNMDYMQHLYPDKTLISLVDVQGNSGLSARCTPVDTTNRAQITTTDVTYILDETVSEYIMHMCWCKNYQLLGDKVTCKKTEDYCKAFNVGMILCQFKTGYSILGCIWPGIAGGNKPILSVFHVDLRATCPINQLIKLTS